MATPQRKVGVVIKDLRYEIEGPLDDAIEGLQKARETAVSAGFNDLYVAIDAYDYYGSTSVDIQLKGSRMETAEEAILREAAEKQRQASLEQRERQQFEALKAKYG